MERIDQHLKILFSQLLEGQSQTLKGQNGIEFNFQSICKHLISLWRKNGVFFLPFGAFFLSNTVAKYACFRYNWFSFHDLKPLSKNDNNISYYIKQMAHAIRSYIFFGKVWWILTNQISYCLIIVIYQTIPEMLHITPRI